MKTSHLILSALILGASTFAQAQEVVIEDGPIMIATVAVPVKLNCQSVDKKINLSGYVPGDHNGAELTFKSDGQTLTFGQGLNWDTNKMMTDIVVPAEDVRLGVFTLIAKSGAEATAFKSLSLIAKPRTMKGVADAASYKVQFKAQLSAFHEREKGNFSVDSEVACQASYRRN